MKPWCGLFLFVKQLPRRWNNLSKIRKTIQPRITYTAIPQDIKKELQYLLSGRSAKIITTLSILGVHNSERKNMPGGELYLIESKPPAVCIQVLLEFFIFVIAALLWLTWCTQHIQPNTDAESKSLAFSLPSYILGWACLMIARLYGSRLKEKFCFSFYLASGIRFMTSAAVLFPQFTVNWFPVVYGLIALLCFITTIFHIVTQTKPERRTVRRLIRPDGTLETNPVNEMMTVKQLETYTDAIRNYMERQDKADSDEDVEPYYVKSVSVITVRLKDSPNIQPNSFTTLFETPKEAKPRFSEQRVDENSSETDRRRKS